MRSQGSAISVEEVSHTFDIDGKGIVALKDFSLEIAEGEIVAIIGPSGCGKTTLLNILAGLEPLGAGVIRICGERPRAGRSEIGYGPVRDCLLPWRNALENVALPLELRGVKPKERHERARMALHSLGLEAAEDLYPAQLSQGMRQRVALARLFVGDPKVLLLDEPFSALDAQTRVLVQDAFLTLWERSRSTAVLITHDLAEAITLADRVIVLTHLPGRLKAQYNINLPRPRSALEVREDPVFQSSFSAIWSDLRQEVGDDAGEVSRELEGSATA
jgi:NitT/TauT family transport system ATP-binding protein